MASPRTKIKPIKRTRGELHKKKKVTAAVVKKRDSIIANRLKKRSKLSSDESPIATTNITTIASTVPIMDTLNVPKCKRKAFYCVTKDKVNLSFRTGVNNYTNMVL